MQEGYPIISNSTESWATHNLKARKRRVINELMRMGSDCEIDDDEMVSTLKYKQAIKVYTL
jgi:hypothetical protein